MTLYNSESAKEVYDAGFTVEIQVEGRWKQMYSLDELVEKGQAGKAFLKGPATLFVNGFSRRSGRTESTTIQFNVGSALFDDTGLLQNPYDVTLSGYWAGLRVATALPIDYHVGKE